MKNSNFYRLLEQEVRHFNGKVTKINERNTKENPFSFYFRVKGLELVRLASLGQRISAMPKLLKRLYPRKGLIKSFQK